MHDTLYDGRKFRLLSKPKAIRMDNGPAMRAAKFVSWAEQHSIELGHIQPGKSNQNAFVERFNRSVRLEVLDARLFDLLAQTQQIPEGSRVEYNTVHSHESLGKKSPPAPLPRMGHAETTACYLSTWR